MMTEDELTNQITNVLKREGYSNWVLKDFVKIKENDVIRTLLDRALMETAMRDYKNRHGVVHGLATAYNAIELFQLIKRDLVKSDYMEIIHLSKDEVLFTLMTASLVHDSGRFYDDAIEANHEEHVNDAIAVLQMLQQVPEILGQSKSIVTQEMIKRVKELCLCHDKKLDPSGKVEIAIMKLADALDTGPHRVYTSEDNPNLPVDSKLKYPFVFQKDKHPGRYFGPLSIDSVVFNWNDREQVLELIFNIKDYSSAEEIKKVINVLQACYRNGNKEVRNFANKIHVYVNDGILERYRVHPTDEDLIRMQTESTQIQTAKVPEIAYMLDILNMKGDTSIQVPLTIQNIDNKDGIDFQPAILGGLAPSKWQELKLRSYEVKGKTTRSLPKPEFLRSDPTGSIHSFNIRFGRKLAVGQIINVKNVCKVWKRFFNVYDDQMMHTVSTPTDKLGITILFPPEANRLKIRAFFHVRNIIEGKDISCNLLEAKKMGDRMTLSTETSKLAKNHSYRIFWKLEG
jgi:metal-dependent HD superfamily phosphatase/phosphodiesterase